LIAPDAALSASAIFRRLPATAENAPTSLALRGGTSFDSRNYALLANKTARENITQALIHGARVQQTDANARADATLRETAYPEKANKLSGRPVRWQTSNVVGIGRAHGAGCKLMLF